MPTKIILDAMGGDNAPEVPVHGAVLAAREGVNVILTGEEVPVKKMLAKHDLSGISIDIVPSKGFIREGENPVRELRKNPSSSIATAAAFVSAGKADGLVSMGSTGATMAASVLALGMFEGLDRPALGGPFITLAPGTSIIDLGSQIDTRPSQLVSFAALGVAFARKIQGIESPRVAILSVGSEPGKGNRLVQSTFPLLERSGLNFVGNIEAHEIFINKAEVVVCDGFVGNILLKFTEGLAAAASKYISEMTGKDSEVSNAIRMLASNAESAGGPLFGVNGTVVIGHGRSPAEHVCSAILRAKDMAELNLVGAMKSEMASVIKQVGANDDD